MVVHKTMVLIFPQWFRASRMKYANAHAALTREADWVPPEPRTAPQCVV